MNIQDLELFDFGINEAWKQMGKTTGFRMQEITETFTIRWVGFAHGTRKSATTHMVFPHEEAVPGFIELRQELAFLDWPSWNDCPSLLRQWQDVSHTQLLHIEEFLSVLDSESEFLHECFADWVFSLEARQHMSLRPAIRGPVITTIARNADGEPVLLDVMSVTIQPVTD